MWVFEIGRRYETALLRLGWLYDSDGFFITAMVTWFGAMLPLFFGVALDVEPLVLVGLGFGVFGAVLLFGSLLLHGGLHAVRAVHLRLLARVSPRFWRMEDVDLHGLTDSLRAPRPYRPPAVWGLKFPAMSEEVAAWRASVQLREELAALGVSDALAATLREKVHGARDVPAGPVIESLCRVDESVACEVVVAAALLSRSRRAQLGSRWASFAADVDALVESDLDTAQAALAARLAETWEGSTEDLAAAVLAL